MHLRKLRNIVLSSVIVSSGFAAFPAQEAHASKARKSVAATKITAAGHGSARFDWLANGQSAGTRSNLKLVSSAPLGKGSWICSPAGFGQQARCYRR